ncbi:MAG: response regulator, partial [Bacteroidales bacterium]|nr:response regulator [Bacteroidales bacterium]
AGNIYRWRPSDGSLVRYGSPESFQGEVIESDVNGQVWMLSTEGSLYRHNVSQNGFDLVWAPEKPLPGASVRDLYPYGNSMLFSVQPGIIMSTDVTSGRTEEFMRVNTGEIRNILHREDGSFWLGTETGVLVVREDGSQEWLLYNSGDLTSLSGDDVWSMFQDNRGNVWIGMFYNGLNLCREDSRTVTRYLGESEGGDIRGNMVRALETVGDHRVLLGTEDGGLSLLNPIDGKVEDLTPLLGTASQYNVQDLYNDSGTLWVATFGHGIFRLDLDSRKQTGNYLTDQRGVVVYKTVDGTLWAGTTDGLYEYNWAKDSFEYRKEMGYSFIHAIFQDSRGKLWVGTYGKGLWVMDNGGFHRVGLDERGRGLASNYITDVTEDHEHRLWVCTEGNGVYYVPVRETDGAFAFGNLSRKEGLTTNIVCSVLQDSQGTLWMSTSHGLIKMNQDLSGVADIFLESSAGIGNQYAYGSSLSMDGGTLFFGTNAGMFRFAPSASRGREMPEVIITDILGEASGGLTSITEEGRSARNSDYIRFRQKDFSAITIRFSMPLYSSARSINFRTVLTSPRRSTFQDFSQNGEMTYTHLPAGKYQFQAFALVAGTPATRTLTIDVIPPFYRSTLAFILYTLLLLGALGFMLRQRDKRRKTEMEKQVVQLESDKQKEVFDAKIQFFTNITHEIRTPLTLIKLPLDKIVSREDLPEDTKGELLTMQANTNRLLTLTNQLLDMRKMEKYELQPNFVTLDLVSLVSEVCSWFYQVAEDQHIHIETTIPGKPVLVQCAKDMVEKILNNLLSNACKYGDGQVRVMMVVSADGETVKVRVDSNGPRIPEKDAERIFDTFYQSQDTQQRKTQGTGLGLPFARSLAALHHGRLYLDTWVPEWNSFVLELPVHQPDAVALPASAPVEEGESMAEEGNVQEAAPETGHRHVILIVDDSPDMRGYLAKELSDNYNVVVAANGQDALDIIKSQRVDLVVADIMMPIMDGCTLCNQIKSDTELSHIPVILLTAAVGMETRIETLEAGADGYIEKPFSFELLQATITNLFRNRDIANQQFVHSPLAHFSSVVTGELDHDFMERLHEVVMRHLSEPDLNIETLTQELGTSKSTLYRKVRANLGLNINE